MSPIHLHPTKRRTSSSLSSSSSSTNDMRATLTIIDMASWYCSIIMVALILFMTLKKDNFNPYHDDYDQSSLSNLYMMKSTNLIDNRPCDEIYVVGEGETLNTISDKCGDPYIVERNPHIHDPDDVFPGLVIKIISSSIIKNRKLIS
ncbi:uncharacterized protein LOC130825469 [Amaranthus tricolor]|uniref:uncharacterized protein LOC130825469 n=1 Tax=Amaranthus tricolor TaxID=29722 RepID=UPI002588A5AF|nr:uncharacterized protein LOC130825469 [Amaranthus tricolor]